MGRRGVRPKIKWDTEEGTIERESGTQQTAG